MPLISTGTSQIGMRCAILLIDFSAKSGLKCHFIDDWYFYHIADGEVHCGTNVKRLPFDFKWWEIEPSELGNKSAIAIEEPELSFT